MCSPPLNVHFHLISFATMPGKVKHNKNFGDENLCDFDQPEMTFQKYRSKAKAIRLAHDREYCGTLDTSLNTTAIFLHSDRSPNFASRITVKQAMEIAERRGLSGNNYLNSNSVPRTTAATPMKFRDPIKEALGKSSNAGFRPLQNSKFKIMYLQEIV